MAYQIVDQRHPFMGIVEGKGNMERLTEKYEKYISGFPEELRGKRKSYSMNSGIIIEKLGAYEDLEERLCVIYGECDGLLEKVVEHLERHEGVDFPGPVFKARLLTDGEVDRWEEYKTLDKQGKLPKLPCEIGHIVYEIYQFMGEGAWEIDEHKIRLEDLDKIGKTVFLTKEAAYAALEDLSEKDKYGV